MLRSQKIQQRMTEWVKPAVNQIVTAPSYYCRAAFSRRDGDGEKPSVIESLMRPDPSQLPDDFNMPIWDHLEELRERVLIGGLAGMYCRQCAQLLSSSSAAMTSIAR